MKVILAIAALCCSAFCQGSVAGGTASGGGTASAMGPGNVTVTSLAVTPTTQGQNVGQTIGYTATATLSNGSTFNATSAATWASSNTGIASFSSLTATENTLCVSAGTVQISASYGGATNSTSLRCNGVLPPTPTLVSIAVTPLSPSVAVGQSVAMTATGTFSDGSTQDITATVTWTSGTPSHATVGPLTATEAVNCIAGGTSLIGAHSGIILGTSTVTCNAVLTAIVVTPITPSIIAGTAIGFIATGSYNDGSKQDVTTRSTWGSTSTSVASLGALTTQQAVNGLSAGTSSISATVGTVFGATALTVTSPGPPPPTLSSIAVTPTTPTVNVNSLLGFKATGTYSDSSTQDVTSSATWTSGNTSVATVQATSNPQNVKCIANGISTIQAAVGAVNGNTLLTCQTPAPTLTSITVTPASQTQYNGSTVQFTATGTYSDASTQNLTSQAAWVSGTPATATIGASTGLATCVANSGSTTITATVSAVSGNTSLACQPASTNTAGNAYCNPNGTWIGPTVDGPATLPIACMNTALSNTPSPGATLGPDTLTSQVQAHINSAACGDTILVNAGSVLSTINLPPKGCDDAHWITIKSTGVASGLFPAEGTRATPCIGGVASMPSRPSYPCPTPTNLAFQIVAPAGGNAITSSGGDHYRFIGAQPTRVSTVKAIIYSIIDLAHSGAQSHHIIFDRSWCAGIEGTFPQNSTNDTSTTRCLYLGQSNHVAIIDSYISNIYDNGATASNGNTDAQCVSGGVGGTQASGWGVYKFVNNHCEGASEGFILGGAGGPAPSPSGCTLGTTCTLDVPIDIEVRQNYFFAPNFWNGNTTTINGVGYPNRKNGIEFKTGARILLEGNVMENCWYNSQPYCYPFDFAPKNQSNGAGTPICNSCLVQDFTARFNYGYNYVGTQIAIYSTMDLGCSACTTLGRRGSVHDNLVGDRLNKGSVSGLSGTDGIELLANAGPMTNISIRHNTVVNALRSLMIFGGISGTGSFTNLVFQDNLLAMANYGVTSGNSGGGCEANNTPNNFLLFLNNCAGSSWTADHNGAFNWLTANLGGTLGNLWPTNGHGLGNSFFIGTSGVGFTAYTTDSGFDPSVFQLTTSSILHNAGSDGKDVGADIVTLQQKIAGVRQ